MESFRVYGMRVYPPDSARRVAGSPRRSSLAQAVEEMSAAAAKAVASSEPPASNDGDNDNDNASGERIRPQTTKTRLSIHLASTDDGSSDDDTSDERGPEVGSNRTDGADDVCGDGGSGEGAAGSTADPELPAWRRTADKVETAQELCVGDIVRARCAPGE